MYRIEENTCTGCAAGLNVCSANAIYMIDHKASIDEHRCNDCGQCAEICPMNAIHETEAARANQVSVKQSAQNATTFRSPELSNLEKIEEALSKRYHFEITNLQITLSGSCARCKGG